VEAFRAAEDKLSMEKQEERNAALRLAAQQRRDSKWGILGDIFQRKEPVKKEAAEISIGGTAGIVYEQIVTGRFLDYDTIQLFLFIQENLPEDQRDRRFHRKN